MIKTKEYFVSAAKFTMPTQLRARRLLRCRLRHAHRLTETVHLALLLASFWQIDGPSRSAWTLPYIVTINEDSPFGMYVSYPRAFDGPSGPDGRLKWYASTTSMDLIMTASVSDMSLET